MSNVSQVLQAKPSVESEPPTLRSITLPLPGLDGTRGLLEFVARNDLHTWFQRGDGFVGFGEAARFTSQGPTRFEDAQAWWQAVVERSVNEVTTEHDVAGIGLMTFGSFSFSKMSAFESRLVVPSVVVGSRQGKSWFTYTTADDVDLTRAAAEDMLARYLDDPSETHERSSGDELVGGKLTEAQWKTAVARGVAHIHAGELTKLVLARDVLARLVDPIDTAGVLRELAVRYQDCWTYSVDGLIGSTPEMLIKVENNTAQARVLAGTLDRSDAPDNDPTYPERILAGSQKQQHEHEIAIDSLTRQLEPFTASMTSHSEPFVLQLPNVWHLASDVTAELVEDDDGRVPTSLALVGALHPTAAVCGTPTTVAGELIRELEHMDRGPYAGPVGWMDARGNGEWGIALRGAVIEDPTHVRLYAGCGVVDASVPEAELAETWSKFRPMIEALGLPY